MFKPNKVSCMLLSAVIGMIMLANHAEAKKMFPLNIAKGEMPGDVSTSCLIEMTEENIAEGAGLGLKLAFSKTGWAGEFKPRKGNWTGYKYLRFSAFNPTDRKVTMALGIKDEFSKGGNAERKTWIAQPYELKPGMNQVEITLEGIKAQDGRVADLKKIKQWFLSYKFFTENSWEEKGDDVFTVFISNFRIED